MLGTLCGNHPEVLPLSLVLLRTLVAVAETDSFAAAAGRVHVSQAAVGQQMRRLEDTLQVSLFDREGKIPHLNPLGRALVPKARAVLEAYDTMLDGLVGDAALLGELTVGAVPSMITALVPGAVKRLRQSYPDLHVRVVPGSTDDLLEQVERGAVDAAIISEPKRFAANLRWQTFATEDMVLVTAPDVAETDPTRILQDQPYIRHSRGTAAGILAEEWLSRNRINVRPAMEMDSLETLSSMVAHGLGVSVVPNVCVPDQVFSGLRKIPLESGSIKRVMGVMTRADSSKLRLVDRLLDEIRVITESNSTKG